MPFIMVVSDKNLTQAPTGFQVYVKDYFQRIDFGEGEGLVWVATLQSDYPSSRTLPKGNAPLWKSDAKYMEGLDKGQTIHDWIRACQNQKDVDKTTIIFRTIFCVGEKDLT